MEKIMEKTVLLRNTKGLHASLAAKLVQVSAKYDAIVQLNYKDQVVDAKSILGLMSLAIPSGENIELEAIGKDAEQAIADIEKILG